MMLLANTNLSQNRPVPFDARILEKVGVKIQALVSDSRQVKPGDTFVAYPGETQDGRKFIEQAIHQGANAIIWESDGFSWHSSWQVPNLAVSGLRHQLGYLANHIYGEPSRHLWMIGITGTNGKTSCSHWIASALNQNGRRTAIVGTLGNGFAEQLQTSANTTPDGIALQKLLAEYVRLGAQCVAMEVSSHGLDQGRVNGTSFDVAVFTNLTQDHLDYHGDMQHYAQAKAKLFAWPSLKYVVINADDEFGRQLISEVSQHEVEVVSYGFSQTDLHATKKIRVVQGSDLQASARGLSFKVQTDSGRATVQSKLLGKFNASNLLAVLASLLVSGVGFEQAVAAAEKLEPTVGRMQKIGGGNLPLVIVDYAHTPDALQKTLLSLRELIESDGSQTSKARLICVFGCGGQRDRGKRPLMGEIATRLSDEVIITSDNPRNENPRAIIDEIVRGAGANHRVVEDRASAIYEAIHEASPGDVVLIAGKGHEQYQEQNGIKLPFSDVEVAQTALREENR